MHVCTLQASLCIHCSFNPLTWALLDQAQRLAQALLAFLPLMVGYFALNVPSGLSLYYFANTVITSGQQIWLRKLGGAAPAACAAHMVFCHASGHVNQYVWARAQNSTWRASSPV